MSDNELRESTASEPLTLQQEYEMCERWAEDEDKLTFIILERNLSASTDDVAAFQTAHQDPCHMIGDANLFLSPNDDTCDSPGNNSKHVPDNFKAELEIMIASTRHRQLGLATEALKLFLSYIYTVSSPKHSCTIGNRTLVPTISLFFVKISIHNAISQRLFQKIGFEQVSTNAIFEEHELRLKKGNYPSIQLVSETPCAIQDESDASEKKGDQAIMVYHSEWINSGRIQFSIMPWPLQDSQARKEL